jgi:hypothetical protein
MPARDPNYRPAPRPQVPCLHCGELLPPDHGGMHEACVREKALAKVDTRCKRCGTTDRMNAAGCTSYFHAENREKKT